MTQKQKWEKIKSLNSSKWVSFLNKMGYKWKRQKGSHRTFEKIGDGSKIIIFAGKPKENIKWYNCKDFLQVEKIERDELYELLIKHKIIK